MKRPFLPLINSSTALISSSLLLLRPRWTTPLVLLGLLLSLPAEGAVIGFDNLNAPGNGTGGIGVGNLYAGIIIKATALDYSQGTPVLPGFAHSGTSAIELCYGSEFCAAPLVMNFGAPQKRVKVWVGSTWPLSSQRTVILRSFDSGGVQIGEATVTLGPSASSIPIATPLEVALVGANIVRATVGYVETEANTGMSFNNGLAFDDVEFDGAEQPFLHLTRSGSTINLSWADSQYVVQRTFKLEDPSGGTVWTPVSGVSPITETMTGAEAFYRLTLASGGEFTKWYSDGSVGPEFNFQQIGAIGGVAGSWPDAQMIATDFNGDDNMDILVFRPGTGGFAKWYSDGSVGPEFNFQQTGFIGGVAGSWPDAQMIATDFNGDDNMDILVFRPGTGGFAKWYSDGSVGPEFNFQQTGSIGGVASGTWTGIRILQLDFNGDEKADLLLFNRN